MDDKALKRLVEDELEWEPRIDAAVIGVSVENGIVRLGGRVETYDQKVAVEHAVRRVKGVRGYLDDLEVFQVRNVLSDQSIAERAAKALEWDAVVPPGAVLVRVDGGRVTLTGKVRWRYQRDAADDCVRGLYGVRDVNNHITIRPEVSADDVQRRIEEAFARQAVLDAGGVTVTVEGDHVRLEGKVRAWAERQALEAAAWSAPGVRGVLDYVKIEP